MKQLTLDVRPAPNPTLDNFVAGSNAELVGTLRALSTATDHAAVFVWGTPGCGRSHLLQATVGAAARDTGAQGSYLRAGDASGILPCTEGTLLAIDDVEQLPAEAQIALFRAFNDARERRLRILISGSAPPLKLALREDLRTRLGSALVFEVKPLTDGEKVQALQHHASQRGMPLKPELIQHLLHHGARDLPSLLAVLDALDQVSLERKRPVTLPLLMEVMQRAGASAITR